MKKCLFLILLVYLIGSFAFSTNEALSHVDSDTNRPAGFFPLIDQTPDRLAENTNTFRKANKHSFSPFRNGFYRVFLLVLTASTTICFVRPHYPLIKNDNTVIFKNNILLKLRI